LPYAPVRLSLSLSLRVCRRWGWNFFHVHDEWFCVV
jgi:hypothetical protein